MEYSKLKQEIEDTETIIFAIKASIQYAENQFEYDTYIEELAYRQVELEELRKQIIQ